MNLVELFTLLAFIVSLLALLVEVVHVTFDIVWRLSHDDGRNDKRKSNRPQFPNPSGYLSF